MLRHHRFVPALAAMLLLAGCDWEDFGSSERYSQDFHYSYALQPGGRLSLENFNGSVEISGWDQPNVDVSGTKYAATMQARDAIKIDINAAPDSISIRTIRPSGYRWNMGARYIVRVPRRVVLDRVVSTNGGVRLVDIEGPAHVKTTNGPIRARNVTGALDGGTTNGSIELDTVKGDCSLKTSNGRVRAESVRGALDVSTRNGGVDLAMDELRQGGVRVSTSNGGITLRLPSRTNARLDARTSNSSISTDFDLHAQGETSKHHLEGTIGTGGPLLDLSTSNGSIRVVRQAGV